MAEKTLNIIQLGRIGDIVTSEPVYRYLRETHPGFRVIWFTRKYFVELLKYSPWVDEVAVVENSEEAEKIIAGETGKVVTVSLVPKKTHDASSRAPSGTSLPPPTTPSLLSGFCRMGGLPDLGDRKPVFHFRPGVGAPEGLPEKYAVFHCASGGKSRQLPPETWKKTAELFFRAGIPVVEVGLEPLVKSKNPLYRDLTEIHDLQVIAKTVEGAACFVGVESGFGHLANALGVYGIILAGRLGNDAMCDFYAGDYRVGKNLSYVALWDEFSYTLPFELIAAVAGKWIAGTPLEGDACRIYCLTYQLIRMRRNPFVRAWEDVAEVFLRMRLALNYHRRARRNRILK